jgi:hypothetical protein
MFVDQSWGILSPKDLGFVSLFAHLGGFPLP